MTQFEYKMKISFFGGGGGFVDEFYNMRSLLRNDFYISPDIETLAAVLEKTSYARGLFDFHLEL